MRKLTLIALVAGLVAAMAAPASAKPKWAEKNDTDIVSFAVTTSGYDPTDGADILEVIANNLDDDGTDYDILVSALLVTGVVDVFDGTDYTVFAPNDLAFRQTVADIAGVGVGAVSEAAAVEALVDILGVDGIADVLAYHVTPGSRPSPSVVNARQIGTLLGETFSARGGTIVANNSTAGFVSTDNRFTDGMVHVVDSVLLP